MRANDPLPSCPECGSLLRPNILMFGDAYWDSSREELQSLRYSQWLNELEVTSFVVIECGAGTAVPTVRYQSEQIADRFGGTVIRINLRDPQIHSPHIGLSAGAVEVLSLIDEQLSEL